MTLLYLYWLGSINVITIFLMGVIVMNVTYSERQARKYNIVLFTLATIAIVLPVLIYKA